MKPYPAMCGFLDCSGPQIMIALLYFFNNFLIYEFLDIMDGELSTKLL
jgi:hypothetical protein